MSEPENRRPLKSRQTAWAKRIATWLAAAGVSPDHISAASLGFAAIGAGLLWGSGSASGLDRIDALIAAGCCIQLRLLCNLLDGMVAVEHGKGGPYGPIWNELPDRFADVLLLIGAGYGAQDAGMAHAAAIGWIAAVLAVLTAYIRELGRALGFAADFSGPMAKPHRMAALTAACAVSAIEPVWGWRGQALAWTLAIIVLGAAITLVRRVRRLARSLAAKAD